MKTIIKLFIAWRLLLFIPVLLGAAYLPIGNSYPFFEITYYQHNLPEIFNYPVLKAWANFDGVHYFNIGFDGYVNQARFFPLLSLLIYMFGLGNFSVTWSFIVALILPNIFFVAALLMFYKLLKLDYSPKISLETIIYLIVFPTSFFFVSVYTESLFLLLTISIFYFIRKKSWVVAVSLGVLLSATRLVGFLIIPAMLYEYFLQNKTFKFKNYLEFLSIILITPLGLLAYAFYNLRTWGSWTYFFTSQGDLGNSRSVNTFITPPQTIYRYFKILITLPTSQFEWWLAVLELLSFTFGCIFIYIAWKKGVRTSYLIFGSLAFLLPVLSGTFSGLPRYVLLVFPIFIAIALLKSQRIKQLYILVSVVLLFILLMFFTKAYFIA